MSRGAPKAAFVSLAVGAGALAASAAGLAPEGAVRAAVAGGGGTLFVLGGIVAARWALRPPPAPSPKPAHVAFHERTRHKVVPPPARPPRQQVPPSPSIAAAPLPEAEAGEIRALDDQIKELSRQIDRAKVMFGTGQLTREGYVAYVRGLEVQRGELEASRARLQMKTI